MLNIFQTMPLSNLKNMSINSDEFSKVIGGNISLETSFSFNKFGETKFFEYFGTNLRIKQPSFSGIREFYTLKRIIESFTDSKYNDKLEDTLASDSFVVEEAIFVLFAALVNDKLPEVELMSDGSVIFIWKSDVNDVLMRFIGNGELSYSIGIDNNKSFYTTFPINNYDQLIRFFNYIK
jgi:hypothetical protein